MLPGVPKLWNDTIEEHRRSVRDATLDATAALVAEHGLLAVTMSQIAERTGIGRATLYKYFPDVGSILLAWHERQVAGHLDQLAQVRARTGGARALEAVLHAYAQMALEAHARHDDAVVAVLHRGEHVGAGEQQVRSLVRELLSEAAATGDIRDDVAPDELAGYCLHALAAARGLRSRPAVGRLVTLVLAGLRPPTEA